MHPSVAPIAAILRLNTELLLNCLAGLDDAAANRRVTPATNSITFLVAHLVDSRHYLGKVIGAPLDSPLADLLAGARSLEDLAALPDLAALIAAWERIAAHLAVHIERLDTPALAAAAPDRLPGGDGSVLGALTFLAQHETYHLGQLGLLRRQIGYPAMSYATRPREPGRAGA